MELHDLILIVAAFVAGYSTHVLLVLWAEHKIRFYRDGWQASSDQVHTCQLREAYRAGQDQARNEQQRIIEAPAPWRWQ